jgi:hypothetical protein
MIEIIRGFRRVVVVVVNETISIILHTHISTLERERVQSVVRLLTAMSRDGEGELNAVSPFSLSLSLLLLSYHAFNNNNNMLRNYRRSNAITRRW